MAGNIARELLTLVSKPYESKRSPKWEEFSKHFLIGKTCAACGTKDNLESHHIIPFHLKPELELIESNLIALCMKPSRWCHFRIGHWFNWMQYCPHVGLDAYYSLSTLRYIKDKLEI